MRVPARGSDDGAAAVEFALVSVLLFTLFFGIIQYGYFFLQSSGAEHAAWAEEIETAPDSQGPTEETVR